MDRDCVVCLYEHSGLSARPWLEAGYNVLCFDKANQPTIDPHPSGGSMWMIPWDAHSEGAFTDVIEFVNGDHVAMLLAFPPCDDLAVSGAKHFAAKLSRDPNFQHRAMERVFVAETLANYFNAPYAIENPVSAISTLWRKPDYVWSPNQYGGYLPVDDEHPLYPDIIEPRDQYRKATCYWIGNGFKVPPRKPLPPLQPLSNMYTKLGGSSERTKRIRNSSPRGMARAIFEANHKRQP